MILRTSSGRNVKSRAQLFGGADIVPLPSQEQGTLAVTGRRVTPKMASGLPAVLRGIRFLSETVGSLPLIVYRDIEDGREKARDSQQWTMLHDKPNDVQTPFGFKSYLVASIIGQGNGYALKAKSRGQVRALYPLDPRRVEIKSTGDSVTYRVRDTDGTYKDLTRADLIHIPGVLLDDPYCGVSPILAAANALGTALAAEEFAGRFYENDATPGGVITMPYNPNTQQAKDTKEFWEQGHKGARRSHRVGVLFGGATYQSIGVDAQAAQIVETQRWSVEQVARAIGLPAWAIGGVDQNPRATPEQRSEELKQYALLPWTVRIEEAFHADDDLFPDKGMFPEFLADGLTRADTAARYSAYLQARQAGWLSVNDIRRKENEPPIDGGDEYQVTPVGGAPNLQPSGGADEEDPNAVEPQENV